MNKFKVGDIVYVDPTVFPLRYSDKRYQLPEITKKLRGRVVDNFTHRFSRVEACWIEFPALNPLFTYCFETRSLIHAPEKIETIPQYLK